jgi:hypothetical protein
MLLEFSLMFLALIESLIIYNQNLTPLVLEAAAIPTMMNGISSVSGLVLAANVAFMGMMISSNREVFAKAHFSRLIVSLFLIGVSASLVVYGFLMLFMGNLELGARISFVGLSFATGALLSFILFVIRVLGIEANVTQ